MNQQPNILLITTDQQRFDTICAGGYEYMNTPNLDRLAEEGCLFTNAYSPNPACIPARHNIISGLTAKYHGFDENYFDNSRQMPYNIPTFPELLSNAGYDTVAIGKMHFQPCRRHNGFNRMYTMEEIPVFRQDDDYAMYLKENNLGHYRSVHGVRHLLYMLPQQSFIPTKHHGSTWVANKTIDIIKENSKKRPFMIWSSFIHPHPPFDVPSEWANLYDDVDLPQGYESITPISPLAEENKHIADYPNKDYLKRAKQLYCSAISFVDYNIGRILDYLEKTNQIDNTLIIFTSDHGEMLGDNGTYQKFLPYDSSSKVPFIVRYPKYINPGTKDECMVDLNDIFPTFLDAAEVDYPANYKLPGESIFLKEGMKDRNYQYVEYNKGNKRWVSLRNKRYKYNYYYGGGKEELFDLGNDSKERVNLLFDCKDSKILEIKVSLRRKLVQYEKTWGLPGYVVDDDFIKLDEYVPVKYRETNFPFHIDNLCKEDKEKLIDLNDEIKMAIKNEDVVNLKELDIETFKKYGKFTDKDIEDLLCEEE
ncbi:sulfatase family protein [Maledivibacter halophilus]|uniref:Arylsulfatase A n=1 Tax=Maledivibacter halophilus TaxID=36842 RepID=A0A1T5LLA7_9FIRM|nr:sulfatase-like hydrolase/transferase [Maledivibacter halophilus]SKC76595.1 Arylsulfatase A [Maledivibacter halophilus]